MVQIKKWVCGAVMIGVVFVVCIPTVVVAARSSSSSSFHAVQRENINATQAMRPRSLELGNSTKPTEQSSRPSSSISLGSDKRASMVSIGSIDSTHSNISTQSVPVIVKKVSTKKGIVRAVSDIFKKVMSPKTKKKKAFRTLEITKDDSTGHHITLDKKEGQTSNNSWLHQEMQSASSVLIKDLPNTTIQEVKSLTAITLKSDIKSDIYTAQTKVDEFIKKNSSDPNIIADAFLARYELLRKENSLETGGHIEPLSENFVTSKKQLSESEVKELCIFMSRDVSVGSVPLQVIDRLVAKLDKVKHDTPPTIYKNMKEVIDQAISITGVKSVSNHIDSNILKKLKGIQKSKKSELTSEEKDILNHREQLAKQELQYALDYVEQGLKDKKSFNPSSFLNSLEESLQSAPEITQKFIEKNDVYLKALFEKEPVRYEALKTVKKQRPAVPPKPIKPVVPDTKAQLSQQQNHSPAPQLIITGEEVQNAKGQLKNTKPTPPPVAPKHKLSFPSQNQPSSKLSQNSVVKETDV